ncbi:MAG TPA: tRNA 2-thiouridine(34) synthase MnmA [Candidatus Paceibacterota bacterium]|nr:tRNA 2-thiouridine(34) synthase MnmA [Candidatus Paceibacterota bacterium]
MGQTVFVGLSGGVDSAVSAALLKSEGYNVIGAFIKIWRPEFIDCPWQEDRLDAMRVCASLQIPFKEIDLSEEYKTTVIDDMVANYARGITPNPDVLCNRNIKFGAFASWARENGADFVATGHYARNIGASLYRGVDSNKDQSYFLWQLTKADLERVLFPVGGLAKPEVRAHAERLNLPVARKKDSQGLCFVGDVTMRDFLAHYVPLEKGTVLDEKGSVIGEHDGAALYTLGERHGFRVTTRSAHNDPHYVIGIDTNANTITVSPDRTKASRKKVTLIDTNWLHTPQGELQAQTRYRETPVACTVSGATVTFMEPHFAPPGQSLVVYDGDKLVGGGIIAP